MLAPSANRAAAMLGSMSLASIEATKQLDRIVALGYPDVADMSSDSFRALARPLISALEDSDLGTDILLVPTRELTALCIQIDYFVYHGNFVILKLLLNIFLYNFGILP